MTLTRLHLLLVEVLLPRSLFPSFNKVLISGVPVKATTKLQLEINRSDKSRCHTKISAEGSTHCSFSHIMFKLV